MSIIFLKIVPDNVRFGVLHKIAMLLNADFCLYYTEWRDCKTSLSGRPCRWLYLLFRTFGKSM